MKHVLMLAVILAASALAVSAQDIATWQELSVLEGKAVAIERAGQKKVFGILERVEADALRIRFADKRSVSQTVSSVPRSQVVKIYDAELRFGGRQTAKGALIGLGAGAAVGTAIYLGSRGSDDDGLAGAAIPLSAVYGAGAGALAGFLTKKSHKTGRLRFEQ